MEWFHNVVLIIHVVGAGLIVSLAIFSILIQSKKPPVVENLKLLSELWKKVGYVFGTQILTGVYLSGVEWDEFSKNPLLWIKLILIVFVAGLGSFLARQDKNKPGETSGRPNPLFPWVVLITYLIIVSLGVLLAESAA